MVSSPFEIYVTLMELVKILLEMNINKNLGNLKRIMKNLEEMLTWSSIIFTHISPAMKHLDKLFIIQHCNEKWTNQSILVKITWKTEIIWL